MGRLTSGEFNIYGKGREQVDVARENRLRNPNGSHTTLGVLGATLIPQLLAFGATQIANNTSDSEVKSSVKKAPSAVSKELTSQDVANILKKYDVDSTDNVNPNYSDIEIALQQKRRELAQLEATHKTEIQEYETAKANYDAAITKKGEYERQKAVKNTELTSVSSEIQTKSARLSAIPSEIDSIDGQIASLEGSEQANTETVKTQIRRLNEQKNKLVCEQKDLRKELGLDENGNKLEGKGLYGKQATLNAEIKMINDNIKVLNVDELKTTMEAKETENVKTVQAYKDKIAEIESDLKKLDQYFGKKSINNQKNAETESIVNLLKKYNNEKDATKRTALDNEIRGAIAVYKTQHPQGGNPTVDRFIELFEQKKTSGNQTTVL
mgnify:CR=1 FL=1